MATSSFLHHVVCLLLLALAVAQHGANAQPQPFGAISVVANRLVLRDEVYTSTLADLIESPKAVNASAQQAVSAVQATLATQAASIAAVTSTVNAQTPVIDATQQNVQRQNATIAQLQSTVTSQAATIGTLQTTVSTQAATIASLLATLATMNTSMGLLETTIARQASNISALQTTSAAQAAAITSLEATVATQASSITALQTTVATQASSISALQSENTLLKARATALESCACTSTSLSTNVDGLLGATNRVQDKLCTGSLVSVQQSVWTVGAVDSEYFVINGSTYLAIAYLFNGVTYSLKSPIYRYNAATGLFDVFQQIDTIGAFDWEYFNVSGVHYLVYCSRYSGSSFSNLNHVVLRFNTTTNQFVQHQTLTGISAVNADAFVINGVTYLALANLYSGSAYQTQSNIYRFNATTALFSPLQQINTSGAFDWEYFAINDSHFIAVANNLQDGIIHAIKSVIYRFNAATGLFDVYQQIDTFGAVDWEYFQIAGTHYLAVANFQNGAVNQLNSVIYRFNSSSLFTFHQNIPTVGASNFKYFALGGSSYLFSANRFTGSTYAGVTSVIYKFNPLSSLFESYQSINTVGTYDANFFTVGTSNFLALANYYDGTNYNLTSPIYKVNSYCEPV